MAYPNLKQSIWLLVLLILIVCGLAIVVAIVGAIIDEPLYENIYLTELSSLVSFILILCYVSHRTGRTWTDMLPLAIKNIDYDWRMWLAVGLSIFGLGIIITELNNAVISVLPMPEVVQDILHQIFGKKPSYLYLLFSTVVIAPLTEEIVHRGIILKGLLAYCTQNRAIVWSGTSVWSDASESVAISNSFYIGTCLCLLGCPNGVFVACNFGTRAEQFDSCDITAFRCTGFSSFRRF